MRLSKSPCMRLSVRVMFYIMRPLAPAAAIVAQFGPAAGVLFRKLRKTRDIVNFMNFTSGQMPRIRGGVAV